MCCRNRLHDELMGPKEGLQVDCWKSRRRRFDGEGSLEKAIGEVLSKKVHRRRTDGEDLLEKGATEKVVLIPCEEKNKSLIFID